MTVIITPKTDGSHGLDVVGPFETRDAAVAWLDGRDGIIKPLVAPKAHLAAREADAREGERDDEDDEG